MMTPGSLAAKATRPTPPWAVKVLNSRVPPPATRLRAPISPPPPPPPVPVAICTASLIQDSSPTSATAVSPSSRVNSRTGSTPPCTSSRTAPPRLVPSPERSPGERQPGRSAQLGLRHEVGGDRRRVLVVVDDGGVELFEVGGGEGRRDGVERADNRRGGVLAVHDRDDVLCCEEVLGI